MTGCFERANKVDKQVAHSKQVGKAAMAKPDKIEAKDTGLQLHEFLECLVLLSFQRANPKYGEVGKNDPAKNKDMVELPTCLENLLKGTILSKAKRDEAPAWMAEIKSSADVQRAIAAREKELRVEWRYSAGKGEQGAQMTSSNTTDTGLVPQRLNHHARAPLHPHARTHVGTCHAHVARMVCSWCAHGVLAHVVRACALLHNRRCQSTSSS